MVSFLSYALRHLLARVLDKFAKYAITKLGSGAAPRRSLGNLSPVLYLPLA